MLGELARRGLQQCAHRPLGKCTRSPFTSAPASFHSQRLGVVAEVDADLFQHRVGIVLDEVEALLVEHLVERDLALDVSACLTPSPRGRRGGLRRRRERGDRWAG